jgi:pimeloyl-ACP methyl ester carboxylesterase
MFRRTLTHRGCAVLTLAVLVAACGGASDIAGSDVTSGAPTTETPPITPSESEPTDGGDGGRPQGFVDPPPGSGLDRYYDQTLAWADCGGGAECATLVVPLDYDEPDGQAISVALKRQRAADQSNRVGSLLINPGGPGASGVDYLSYARFDRAITDVYDVVGFDPRGVARSTPVDCLSDAELDAFIASDPTPDDDAEVQQLRDDWSNFTAGCVEKSGPLLEHLSTVEAARDMDVMRQVLGDETLNFFGSSYGTYLGATYAGLFPDKVGRFVLDGAVDPLEDRRQNQIDQTAGFEVALTAYLESCVAEGNCPLGDDVESARQGLIQFFEEVDADPLPTSDGRPVTEGVAQLGVSLPLYSADLWPALTASLLEASGGRGNTLLFLADAYSTRQKDGTFGDNRLEAQPAVNCLDHPQDESLEEIKAGADDFIEASPVFGPAFQWFPYGCSNWPVESTEEQPDFAAVGAPPIVVVGTTRDPATPYQSAVDLAETLDSGVLLSRDGDGHTAYGAGNDCIDAAIHTYLVEGTPPADGTQC